MHASPKRLRVKTVLHPILWILIFALGTASAQAQTTPADMRATMQELQNQILALQKQVAQLQAAQAATAPAATAPAPQMQIQPPAQPQPQTEAQVQTPAPAPAAGTPNIHDGIIIKAKDGIEIKPGGFVDVDTIYRSKNQSSDFTSNLNTGIPFNNVANAHQSEYRETARQTRLSLKLTENLDPENRLAAYGETDFGSAASTSTSNNINSYVPRLRQAWASYDYNPWGLHLLAGQAWSLLTTNKEGITPLTETIPMTIDASYSAGFNFTRNPQLRLVKDFDDNKLWVGFSAESPQAIVTGLPCTASATSGACAGFNSTYSVTSAPNSSAYASNVTTDTAPDLILKTAYEPGWGHYEAFGIARFFHDNVNASFDNNVVVGGGAGAAAILPVIPKELDIQANFMIGEGIGRYGATQMPDFAITPGGAIKPISEYTALLGVVGHPDPSWDLYLYAGEEKVFREDSNNAAYGYGGASVSNAGCYILGGSCSAATSSVWEFTPGFWKRVYDGRYGKAQFGLQNSILRRNAFADASGSAPHAYEDIAMFSVRYYPF